jgi:flagellar hook protein FlgE
MDVSAIALGGVDRASMQFQDAATRIASSATNAAPDTVDLSAAAVSMLTARNDFAANLNVLKIADKMQRSAIDMLG